MRYIVVSEKSLGEIISKVNELINDGWEPQGGICVQHLRWGCSRYYQAMILSFK